MKQQTLNKLSKIILETVYGKEWEDIIKEERPSCGCLFKYGNRLRHLSYDEDKIITSDKYMVCETCGDIFEKESKYKNISLSMVLQALNENGYNTTQPSYLEGYISIKMGVLSIDWKLFDNQELYLHDQEKEVWGKLLKIL
jgi:hypothetical protein